MQWKRWRNSALQNGTFMIPKIVCNEAALTSAPLMCVIFWPGRRRPCAKPSSLQALTNAPRPVRLSVISFNPNGAPLVMSTITVVGKSPLSSASDADNAAARKVASATHQNTSEHCDKYRNDTPCHTEGEMRCRFNN